MRLVSSAASPAAVGRPSLAFADSVSNPAAAGTMRDMRSSSPRRMRPMRFRLEVGYGLGEGRGGGSLVTRCADSLEAGHIFFQGIETLGSWPGRCCQPLCLSFLPWQERISVFPIPLSRILPRPQLKPCAFQELRLHFVVRWMIFPLRFGFQFSVGRMCQIRRRVVHPAFWSVLPTRQCGIVPPIVSLLGK